jgi:hypothetical protein
VVAVHLPVPAHAQEPHGIRHLVRGAGTPTFACRMCVLFILLYLSVSLSFVLVRR